MTDDEILAEASQWFKDMPGNLVVTGAGPKNPQDVRDLVGLSYVTGDWMRSVGLGRRARLGRREVTFAARDLRRQADVRASQAPRRFSRA